MKCPFCGTENPEGVRVCVRCAGSLDPATQPPVPQIQQPTPGPMMKRRNPMIVPVAIIIAVIVVGSVVIAAVVLGNSLIPGQHLEITNAVHSTAPKDDFSTYLVFVITVKNKGTEAGSATISCNATYGTYMTGGGISFSSNSPAATQQISLASGEEQTYTLEISIASTYLTTGHFVKYYERLN